MVECKEHVREHRVSQRNPLRDAQRGDSIRSVMLRSHNPLDDTDRAIIERLQADGRTPYTRLGAAVGLSEAAVRQRVQRLLDAGVMQVVTAGSDQSRLVRVVRPAGPMYGNLSGNRNQKVQII